MMKFLSLTLAATIASSVHGFAGDNPPCEICGCSFCTEGEFPVLNPGGIIEITEEFLNEFGGQAVPGEGGQTVGDTIGDIGLTEIPCSLLELAASGGAFPPEVCVDELRLNSILRDTCGCPALPPQVVVEPTDAPVPAPTDAPMPAPTEPPIPAPTEPPVPAPTEPPVPAPTEPPVPAPTEPPMPAPTEPPMPAPTDPPMPAPTDPPVPASTEPPIPAPTDPPMAAPTEPPVPAIVVVPTEPPMPAPVPAPVPEPTGGIEMPTMERCARRKRRRRQRRD